MIFERMEQLGVRVAGSIADFACCLYGGLARKRVCGVEMLCGTWETEHPSAKSGLWVRPLLWPSLSCRVMDRLFGKKPKKSLKSSQRSTSPGIPTDVVTGSLSSRAELDVGPHGERAVSITIWRRLT